MANKIFQFVGVSKKGTERSNFDLNHENKLTFNYGEIVPTLVTQLLPGDSGRVRTEHILRQQTMLAPVMQRSNVSHHFFKVPPRLVDRNFTNKRMRWDPRSNTSWDCIATHTRLSEIAKLTLTDLDLSTAYWEPSDSNPVSPSYFETNDSCLSQSGSLLDFMGIPCGPHFEYHKYSLGDSSYTSKWENITPPDYYASLAELADVYGDDTPQVMGDDDIINLYPFLCYQLVYMTFYRAQDYETDWLHEILELIQPISDRGECVTINNIGLDNFKQIFKLRHRGYSKDYFTSALPHALKSTEWPNGVRVPTNENEDQPNSFSIEMLRLANSIQQWLERDARGGTRYPEWTLSHYGVNSSNALLDLPEFVGGSVAPLSVSDVDQTSPYNDFTEESQKIISGYSPLGSSAGKSVNYDNSGGLSFYSEEDSYIFCLTSVMPKQGYSQGIKKELLRTDFLDDYYMPEFANLGEQPVKRSELLKQFCIINYSPSDGWTYEQNDSAAYRDEVVNKTIGYQSRYADWKFLPDEIHGEFRNSLNYWHMSRIFSYLRSYLVDSTTGDQENRINIGKDFIACHPSDVDRVFVAQSQVSAQIKLQIFFDFTMRRPMPEFPIPSL